jgi:hypothetical protein
MTEKPLTTINQQQTTMYINRHNYENFFLLYVDNELSAADRKAVEVFVQENADLKAELQILQQTVFNADDIVFDNKQSLLKDEMASVKEQLMLYLDGELNTADALQTSELLKVDEAAQKEWALLQRTQIQPDTAIVFANKQSLYRKEERKVVRIAWYRIAAAAVLLGFGTWATVAVINNSKTNEGTGIAGTNKSANTPAIAATTSTNPQKSTQANTNDVNANHAANNTTITTANTATVTNNTKQKNNQPAVTNVKEDQQNEKQNNTVAVTNEIKKPSNNLPQPLYNNFNSDGSNKTVIASVKPIDKAIGNVNSGNTATTASSNNTNAGDGYALNTKFTQGNGDEQNDNKVLYMDEDNVKKSKLGGLFRKVKRLVERNTNIKTGNGIKVAGFDIAIK